MITPDTLAGAAAARLRSIAEDECARWHEPPPADLDPGDPGAGFVLRYGDGSALAVTTTVAREDTAAAVDAVMTQAVARRATASTRGGTLTIRLEDLRALLWQALDPEPGCLPAGEPEEGR